MTLLILLVGSWAMLIAAKGTPIGAMLRRWMIERPMTLISRIQRQTVLTVAALTIALLTLWLVIGHEGIMVFGIALPELGAALAVIDLGVVFDIAVVTTATFCSARWRMLQMVMTRRMTRVRAPGARRSRRAIRRPANEDDPAWALAA